MKNPFHMYRGLPKSIYVLFAAQIVNAVGNLVYPFLTFFLTQRLGYDSAKAGLFILAASLAYVPGSLIGGKAADVLGRKRVLIFTQGMAGVMLLPCAFLGTSPAVPWLLIATHFFFGAADPTHEAIAIDLTTGPQRKAAFSLIYLGHNIGFAVGPMIAGFLFTHALPLLFIGDAFTTFVALFFVFLFIPETKPTEEEMEEHGADEETANERAESGTLMAAIMRRPFLLAFALISTFMTFVYAQFTFSLPLQLEEVFPAQGPMWYGSLMTINALVVIFFTTPLIGATGKLPPLLSVALSALLLAVGFGMLYFAHYIWIFIVSVVVWTLGEVLMATNQNVYIASHTPISHRGRFNSIFPLIIGTGFAIGPPVMGAYIEYAGLRAVWPLMGALAAVCSAALILLYHLEKRCGRHEKRQVEGGPA